MLRDPNGEPMLVLCSVKDTDGQPIKGVKINVWQTDSSGRYDVQHANRAVPDGRAVLHSNQDGIFWYRAVKPVPYSVPHGSDIDNEPVVRLLKKLGRHFFRPAHTHFVLEKEGYEPLITYVLPNPSFTPSLPPKL
jgi:protocatechuate 3,4-dioxygenase beta subunit